MTDSHAPSGSNSWRWAYVLRGAGVVAMTEVGLFLGRAMHQVALHLGSASLHFLEVLESLP